MNRIKLPEKLKIKRVILIILVILVIVVLFFERIDNNKVNSNINKQEENIKSLIVPKEDIDKHENDTNSQEITQYNERERNLYNEAYTLFFSSQYENAINKANELIGEFPSSSKGYNIRGIAKAYNGSFEEGMEDIDKSLKIEPNYGYAMFNKALTYELYDKFDDALLWYNKNLEVENYIWTYYGIASIYGRRGDVENTVRYLKTAIGMNEDVKKEAKNESDFNPVKDSKEFQELIK